jgi:hypothetical protein
MKGTEMVYAFPDDCLAAAPLHWEDDARDQLEFFKAAANFLPIAYRAFNKGLLRIGEGRPEPIEWAERTTDALRTRAVEAAALAGWLTGLEVRDEVGERIRGIVKAYFIEGKTGLGVDYDDGKWGRLENLCADLTVNSHFLALPESAKLFDDATIEALGSRVGQLSDRPDF